MATINVQEFNGDILVDGSIQSDSLDAKEITTATLSVTGSITTPLVVDANVQVTGTITADFLNDKGSATNQAMSQNAVTNLFNQTHPIGQVYLSINSTSPASLFGGVWLQYTGDAYLKIVTSDAGKFGGTSTNHTIPIASMPSHNHDGSIGGGSAGIEADGLTVQVGYDNSTFRQTRTDTVNSQGGGEAYYPYYLGIYAWFRLS